MPLGFWDPPSRIRLQALLDLRFAGTQGLGTMQISSYSDLPAPPPGGGAGVHLLFQSRRIISDMGPAFSAQQNRPNLLLGASYAL